MIRLHIKLTTISYIYVHTMLHIAVCILPVVRIERIVEVGVWRHDGEPALRWREILYCYSSKSRSSWWKLIWRLTFLLLSNQIPNHNICTAADWVGYTTSYHGSGLGSYKSTSRNPKLWTIQSVVLCCVWCSVWKFSGWEKLQSRAQTFPCS
jgi:hypothetical protein